MYGTMYKEGLLPGHELFLAPLEIEFDPTVFENIQFAYVVSKYGHGMQIRDDGSRYFDHPKAACWIYINELGGRNPRIIILILLHDVPEDSFLLSLFRIKLNFGEDIALDLRALSKLRRRKEEIEVYLHRVIARGPWAIVAKLCDRLSNVRTLGGCEPEKQKRQLEETKNILMPLLIPALRSCGEEWTAYADVLEQKLNESMVLYYPKRTKGN